MPFAMPIWDTFAVPSATAAGATAFTALIPPYRWGSGGEGGAPSLYGLNVSGGPNWTGQHGAFTHVDTLLYTTAATAHKIGIMRPLNWTTFAAAVAKNATAITLTADPGVFSTNYKYPTPGGVVPALADDTIATSDYVAYQLNDGTWQLDTIASGTFAGANLVLTTGTANTAGATIAKGNVLFFFGIIGDTDPGTGLGQWQTTSIASATRATMLQEAVLGGLKALHRGDPMIFYSPNTTNAGLLDHLSGYYSPR